MEVRCWCLINDGENANLVAVAVDDPADDVGVAFLESIDFVWRVGGEVDDAVLRRAGGEIR